MQLFTHQPFLRTLSACALATALLSAPAAYAGPVTVTLTHWAYEGNQVNLSDAAGASIYNGRAGAFAGSLSGAGVFDSPSFMTYCIELEEGFRFSANGMAGYRIEHATNYFASRRQDADIADRLGRLMTYVAADPSRVDSAAESTSLQLAVWNLVYDKDFSLGTGSLRDSSSYAAYATQLLAGAGGVTASGFDVFALSNSGTQDFLLVSAKAPVVKTKGDDGDTKAGNGVPEPGTLALSGLAMTALLALAAAKRRNERRKNAAMNAARTPPRLT
jgi:PEP-CTERM motif